MGDCKSVQSQSNLKMMKPWCKGKGLGMMLRLFCFLPMMNILLFIKNWISKISLIQMICLNKFSQQLVMDGKFKDIFYEQLLIEIKGLNSNEKPYR